MKFGTCNRPMIGPVSSDSCPGLHGRRLVPASSHGKRRRGGKLGNRGTTFPSLLHVAAVSCRSEKPRPRCAGLTGNGVAPIVMEERQEALRVIGMDWQQRGSMVVQRQRQQAGRSG